MRVGRLFGIILVGTVLSFSQVLFGCKSAPKHARHTASELSSVALSCGGTDLRQSYSFFVTRRDDTVLFDAECFDLAENPIKIDSQRLDDDTWRSILSVIDETDSISCAKNHRKSRQAHAVADGDVYAFCLTFSDGCRYTAPVRREKLESLMRRVAESLATEASEN